MLPCPPLGTADNGPSAAFRSSCLPAAYLSVRLGILSSRALHLDRSERSFRTYEEPADVRARALDVEVSYVFGVLLDKLAARLHVVAHQRLEQLVRFCVILHVDLQDRAALRVHRRLPELVGVHLSQTLVALDVDA